MIARDDIIHRQGAQTADTEVFTDKRANDIAVYDSTLDIFN